MKYYHTLQSLQYNNYEFGMISKTENNGRLHEHAENRCSAVQE
jgi:hypothetical protein